MNHGTPESLKVFSVYDWGLHVCCLETRVEVEGDGWDVSRTVGSVGKGTVGIPLTSSCVDRLSNLRTLYSLYG